MRHNLNKCVISELSGSSERAKIHSRTPAGESAESLARSVNESRRGHFRRRPTSRPTLPGSCPAKKVLDGQRTRG